MDKLKTKWNSILYNFNTEDRYAGFQSHQKRVVSPFQNKLANGSTAFVNASLTDYPEESFDPGDEFRDAVAQDVSNGEGVKEVNLAWNHINKWVSKNLPDLYEALSSPVTSRDLLEAQKDLKVTLPLCVSKSLQIHDGQDSMPGTGGLIFGLELMDLDSVVKMTKMWRKVCDRLQNDTAQKVMQSKIGNMSQPQLSHANSNNLSQSSKMNNLRESGSSSATYSSNEPQGRSQSNKFKREIPKQNSVPPGAIQPVYAHPMWIPLLTDNAGNHVGVDLLPGPKGKWGQAIIFGREFDTKYVIAPSWGDFLLIFANDLELKNWRIEGDEDNYVGNGELIFNDRATKKDQLYLSVLVSRSIKVHKQQIQQDRKTHLTNVKPLPRTPDLIDANSPMVNELEVFPDSNNAIEKVVSHDDSVDIHEVEADGVQVDEDDVDVQADKEGKNAQTEEHELTDLPLDEVQL